MLKLCLTVILLGCVTQINCESLPVFIWGQKTPTFLPALNPLKRDEFVTLVKSQSDKETLTVVFVEENLSVEDLSQCKLNTATCFENLRKVQETYLMSVEDPVEALEASFNKQSQKSISVTNHDDLSDKVDGSEKILFVYLDAVDGQTDFAKHDDLMSKLYNSIAHKGRNVIAIYTARRPSFIYSKQLVRKTREAADAKQEAEAKPVESAAKSPETEQKPQAKQEEAPTAAAQTVLVNNHFLFALSGLKIKDQTFAASDVVLSVNETGASHLMGVTLTAGGQSLLFNIVLSGGTWYVQTYYLGDAKYHSGVPISASNGRSFGCGDLRLTHIKDGVYSYIEVFNVQMQPLFNPTAGATLEKFSDRHNDCVGFFSASIWGALFVVILLLSILTWGLTMIMDIRTMDRFDDPKGKTININAQE